MRLAAVFVAIVPLLSGPGLAQDTSVLSVTQVSYGATAAVAQSRLSDNFPGGNRDDIGFDLGRADGSGFVEAEVNKPARRATSRAIQTSASQNRVKKSFIVPWQTGVFQ